MRLLDLSKQGVTLTPQGATFLIDAKRLLDLGQETVKSVQRTDDGPRSPLNIGYVANLFYDVLPVTTLTAFLPVLEIERALIDVVAAGLGVALLQAMKVGPVCPHSGRLSALDRLGISQPLPLP